MELKFGYLADTTPNRTGSNRTFMELKYDFERLIDSQKIRSNRTFMELKCREEPAPKCPGWVLIAPLWN